MNIYEYDDIAKFLKDSFFKRIKENSNLSIKSFSNKMGISSSSAFNQMLRGHRPVPAKFIPLFAKELKLDVNEINYLNELYIKSRSGSKFSKGLLKKINPTTWRKKLYVKADSFKSPLSFVLKTFNKRNIELSPSNINEHFLNYLDKNDLISLINNLNTKGTNPSSNQREVTEPDTNSDNIKKAHKYFLQLAQTSLDQVDINRREFNSYSINIKEDQIPEVKKRIRFFLDSIIEDFGCDEKANATFQIGNYFYPLTKKSEP